MLPGLGRGTMTYVRMHAIYALPGTQGLGTMAYVRLWALTDTQ